MPGYEPQFTQYLGRVNALIRLTKEDSVFLLSRLQEAITHRTGVNLVFRGMNGAFSITTSNEQGEQIKCIAFNKSGSRVESKMRGYNGPWSHIELAFPHTSTKYIGRFLTKANQRQSRNEVEIRR